MEILRTPEKNVLCASVRPARPVRPSRHVYPRKTSPNATKIHPKQSQILPQNLPQNTTTHVPPKKEGNKIYKSSLNNCPLEAEQNRDKRVKLKQR